MSTAFAKDYVGCEVMSKVEFLAFGTGEFARNFGPYVMFQAVPPGQGGVPNPTSGTAMGYFVGIHKSASDRVFEFKPGDLIMLFGATTIAEDLDRMQVTFLARGATPVTPATTEIAPATPANPPTEATDGSPGQLIPGTPRTLSISDVSDFFDARPVLQSWIGHRVRIKIRSGKEIAGVLQAVERSSLHVERKSGAFVCSVFETKSIVLDE